MCTSVRTTGQDRTADVIVNDSDSGRETPAALLCSKIRSVQASMMCCAECVQHNTPAQNILVANQPLSISHTRLQDQIIARLLKRGHRVTVLKWAIAEQVRDKDMKEFSSK